MSRAPRDAAGWDALGRTRAARGDLRGAVACFRKAVSLEPGRSSHWHDLGTALRRAGDAPGALAAYRRALELDPKRADTYLNLGNLLVDDGQTVNAIESFRRAAALDPRLPQARSRLAGELSGRGDVSEAERVYRQAVALDPRHAQGWFGLGRTLEDLGRAEEAERCYREVLAIRSAEPWALGQLLGLDGAVIDPPLVAAAERALCSGDSSVGARALLGYGLGKLYDRRGEYDRAFDAFRTANEARRISAGPFDGRDYEERVDRIVSTFTREFWNERGRGRDTRGLDAGVPAEDVRDGFGDPTREPVFIVGMPRSGTTLTEQILASHPRMFGAGELPDLARLATGCGERFALEEPWPLSARRLSGSQSRELARDYLSSLRAKAPAGMLRISDKAPLNFFHLGFGGLLLPGARVVHCRRNPIDTCLSIYFENFRPNQRHATSLEDLVVYHRGYERLMAHWGETLPLDTFEVVYEDLVGDLEGRARAVVDFLGVPWDARCLAFYETARAVQTPSRWQVRRPIYGSSVGRWRRYAKHVTVLVGAFGEG